MNEETDWTGDWMRQLRTQFRKGADHYGDKSFHEPPDAMVGEILTEQIDIAGWLFVLWVQRRKALGIPPLLTQRPLLEDIFVARVVGGEVSKDDVLARIEGLAQDALRNYKQLRGALLNVMSVWTKGLDQK